MTEYDYIRDGNAIYERSFAMVREEADLSGFTPDQAEIAIRMIYACGQVEAAQHFRFSPDFVTAARGECHRQTEQGDQNQTVLPLHANRLLAISIAHSLVGSVGLGAHMLFGTTYGVTAVT